MTLLGVDTAGPVVGLALLHQGQVRSWSARVVRGADALLTPALAELLQGIDHLDAVAVSVGPGAFTSLRVGVATALGVAQARGCPVVQVGSLEARAAMAGPGRVLALLDGRKGRAYAALFQDGRPLGEVLDQPPEQVCAVQAPFVAVGEGAQVFSEQVLAAGGSVHPQATHSPAEALVRLAAERLDDAVSPLAVRLRYVRAPDAKKPKPRS